MTHPSTVRQRVEEAGNLAEVLDAAYEAFETMLSVIDVYYDADGPFYAGLLMAAAAAADGRDALLDAPSLPLDAPSLPLPPRDDVRAAEPEGGAQNSSSSSSVAAQAAGDPVVAAAKVAALSASVATGLRRAAAWAVAAADRAACLDAARFADEVLLLTRGNGA